MRAPSALLLASALAVGVALAGPPIPVSARAIPLCVYFVRGEKVVPVARPLPPTVAVGAASLRELLRGPSGSERRAGYGTLVPSGTRLRGLEVRSGTATVDLSRRFASGGGSLSMRGRIAQVVYTLTQFPTVRRVGFRLDGKRVRAIGGEGVVVDPPVGRSEFRDLAGRGTARCP